ncbi:serine/threonine-protein phosphatase 6 regulatory subunit 1 isoform X2 [Hyla sarda]|uniref:serine/threonine-protein phosphatase 6 regulatory subunit 1 isoform X1 n=1 Tax=Hyla sarda TaxID=327740 RepID=UPI0024C36C5A|nr:serine/threonine-protein phosphatase 6 regulatory subunit 1 isoform X1 [Hyla sarda]XP_056399877.1 serine/threonine-protein phosphatase 6 regulatory subunit 1 isoform X2 [Hyla sarda]
MFWKFDLHTSSHVDTLLERENVTLFELLDEEDVLQECKVVNRKLVEFLIHPQHMEELVTCITQEPVSDTDEKLRYKYPSVSCEILTADVTQINDALGEDESLLKRLYSFLQNEDDLNPLLASFFSKVMGILINRKTEQIIAFLRKKDDFVNLLLRHIGTSAIMDLLLRLLTCVEQPQLRQDVFNWLNEEKIVQRLIEMIHPSKDDNQHSNASQSLCDIIRLSREQMIQIQDSPEPDQLLATLEKQENIEQLLRNMFEGEHNESVIVNGIQVLLTLLEPRRPRAELGGLNAFYCNLEGQLEINPPSGDSSYNTQASLGTLLAIKQSLKDFHQLLIDPPKKESLQTTWGVLDPPLGNTRLHVVKLLTSIVNANNMALNQELIELDSVNTMLNLYFKYMYNNFLHSQVEACVTTILNSTSIEDANESNAQENLLVKYLLQTCQLVQRILSAWEDNEKEQSEGGRRKGFMGHLTKTANALVQSSEKGSNTTLISQLIKELPDEQQERWESFISGSLTDTNKKNTVDLVNTRNMHSSSDDEDSDLKEFNFPQEAVLQQAFVDYQMQQMTSAFIDHFGFNDEEFGEQEESVNAHFRQLKSAPFDKTANITFSLNADEESPNSNLFEICYKERIQQFDDDEDDGSDGEDIWQEKEIRFSSGTVQSAGTRSCGSTDSEDSRDSDEEEEDSGGGASNTNPSTTEPAPETSRDPSWTASFDSTSTDALVSPSIASEVTGSSEWEKNVPNNSSEEGWAVFTDLSKQTSFQSTTPAEAPIKAENCSAQEVNNGEASETSVKETMQTSATLGNSQESIETPQCSAAETGTTAPSSSESENESTCSLTLNGETAEPVTQDETVTEDTNRVEDRAPSTSKMDSIAESKQSLELTNDTLDKNSNENQTEIR